MKKYIRIADIQADLYAGIISCVQLVDFYLKQIEGNLQLNAFLEVWTEEAKLRALEIDEKIKSKSAGTLAGLVIAIKDNICYENHHVSASSKILKGFKSIYSSTVIERLLAQDAIIIGRTNCDEFAMGASNENSAYGPVKNAQDPSKVPGGSSGGSAVAVQANMCHAALGSDTGGSIRQPASFTGTIGIKPTYGLVSRWGLLSYASSFDQIGPITQSIEDNALILSVISGKDNHDATCAQIDPTSYSINTDKKYSIAVLKDAVEHPGLENLVKQKTIDAIEKLTSNGHQITYVDFPYLDYMVPCYYVLTTAEASSNLSRYNGLLFGHRSENAIDLESTFKKSRSEGFGEEVQRRIMLGTFVLSSDFYDAYYQKAQKVRNVIRQKTIDILKAHDAIFLPTTNTTAFELGEKSQDPIAMYLADLLTVQAPLAGLPAISFPANKLQGEMPVGLQLICNSFEEEKMFNIAKTIIDITH